MKARQLCKRIPDNKDKSGNTYRTEVVRVFILNNKFTNDGVEHYRRQGAGIEQYRRQGAEHDSQNLKMTFNRLGYEVTIFENLTKECTEKEFDRIRDDKSLENVDSIIFFILSHGANSRKRNPFAYYSNDMKKMSLTDLRRSFSDNNCPQLRGKPKLFFCNFCRGPKIEIFETDDYRDYSLVPLDTLTIHAASEECVAFRDPDCGTIFVNSLCEVLNEAKEAIEIGDVYNELCSKMRNNKGTTPVYEKIGFIKKFFFRKNE